MSQPARTHEEIEAQVRELQSKKTSALRQPECLSLHPPD